MEDTNLNTDIKPQDLDVNEDVEMEELEPSHNRQRLIIEKIILENFKSYAGIREIGPFHKSFTSIVGPNGSGKSNVIDALLFVFGKRASKLRLKKVSELIHNSAEHHDYTYASVSVYFTDIIDLDDEDKYESVPNSQVKISRIAYKNNQSKYTINDKNSNFTEVTELLKKRGIDLDNNRFLILQGEVEQISLMKAKAQNENDEGLLEYLEDIIGSNSFIESIETKEKELDEITEKRQEYLNRVKLVQKERDGLEDAKIEAERFLSIERDILIHKGYLLKKQLYTENEQLNMILKRKNELLNKYDTLYKKYSENDTILKTKSEEYKKIEEEYQIICKEMEKTKADYNAFERLDIEYRESLKGYKNTLKQMDNKISTCQKNKDKNEKSIQDYQSSLPQMEKNLKFATERKDEEQQKLDVLVNQLKGITKDLRIQKEAIQKQLQPLLTKKEEYLNKSKLIDTEIECIYKKQEQEQKERTDLLSEQSNTQKKLDSINQDLITTKSLLDEKNKALEVNKNIVYMNSLDVERITAELRNKRQISADLKSLGTTEKSRIITAIMEQTQPNGCLYNIGICGRLGDLGCIDKTYDIPISTASGSWGDLVVETTEGGQKVIEWLKREKVGKIRCIILDKLKYLNSNMSKQFVNPSGAQRLYDLIKPDDEKYRSAFYYALRDTLVANNLDIAVQLCYKDKVSGRRVVTLSGQLIDTNGTMTGGGTIQRKGQVRLVGGSAFVGNSQSNTLTIEENDKNISLLEKELTEKRQEMNKSKSLIKTLQDTISAFQLKISKYNIDIESMKKTLDTLNQRVNLLPKEEMINYDDKIHDLQNSKNDLETEFKQYKVEIDKFTNQINDIDNQIKQRGGENFLRQQKSAEDSKKGYEQIQKEITTTTISIKNLNKQQVKIQNEIEKFTKEKEETEQKINSTKEKFKQIEEDATRVMEAFNNAQKAMQEKEISLSEIKGQFEKYKKDGSSLKKEVDDISEKKDEEEKKYDEKQKKINSLNSRFDSLRNQVQSLDKELNECNEDFDSPLPVEEKDKPTEEKKSDEVSKEDVDMNQDINADKDLKENSNGLTNNKNQVLSSESDIHEETTKVVNQDSDVHKETTNEDVDMNMDEEDEEEVENTNQDCFFISENDLINMNISQVEKEIMKLEGEKDILQKQVNISAIHDYNKKNREMRNREKELDEVTEFRDNKRKEYDELRKQRLNVFMSGFNEITLKLKEMYQMITLGGDAELELVDSLDPFSEGIVFSVRPPKKSWKNISNLSGGEKTLSSLALIFALHHFKPTSLYILDEIDAALDFRNVSIVAHYIKERTKDAQFIIISLRNNMFELADRLVGIYKTNNATKSVTLNPKQLATNLNLAKE